MIKTNFLSDFNFEKTHKDKQPQPQRQTKSAIIRSIHV